MMTAGQIADEFCIDEVGINYRASQVLDRDMYSKNPLSKLEWAKYECDFSWMVQ